jgi:hypothetical protein
MCEANLALPRREVHGPMEVVVIILLGAAISLTAVAFLSY